MLEKEEFKNKLEEIRKLVSIVGTDLDNHKDLLPDVLKEGLEVLREVHVKLVKLQTLIAKQGHTG
jgi:hypothetical protein